MEGAESTTARDERDTCHTVHDLSWEREATDATLR